MCQILSSGPGIRYTTAVYLEKSPLIVRPRLQCKSFSSWSLWTFWLKLAMTVPVIYFLQLCSQTGVPLFSVFPLIYSQESAEKYLQACMLPLRVFLVIQGWVSALTDQISPLMSAVSRRCCSLMINWTKQPTFGCPVTTVMSLFEWKALTDFS